MWIRVRSMDGQKTILLDDLSKLTPVEDVHDLLVKHFDARPDRQRLFYRGKQLVKGHTLFDYDVHVNDIVQIMVSPTPQAERPTEATKPASDDNSIEETDRECQIEPSDSDTGGTENIQPVFVTDSIYKIGDIIDVRCLDDDASMGSWFEADIVNISEPKSNPATLTNVDTNCEQDLKENVSQSNEYKLNGFKSGSVEPHRDNVAVDGYDYHVIYQGYEEGSPSIVKSKNIRPRASKALPFEDIEPGTKVMVNYNSSDPDIRGFWYDAVVTGRQNFGTNRRLIATVYLGTDLTALEDCKIKFVDEIMAIEEAGTQKNKSSGALTESSVKREVKPNCDHCQDDSKVEKCKYCGCQICHGTHDQDRLILCDECDEAYHMSCLKPPLIELPPEQEEWYCPQCKNHSSEIVQKGEKLKAKKKKVPTATLR